MTDMRIGHGYDVHCLVGGRRLVIGGVPIPFDRGLDGHSDADVLVHAICDAILGAAGLGDIGRHFPDTAPEYAGISSLILLRRTGELAGKSGYRIGNVDATVIAQAPRMSPYIPQMTEAVAGALSCGTECINIKATTEEHLGFTGSGEGIAAHAVCLLIRN